MRHILVPGPVSGLPRGVVEAAGPAVLIAAAGGSERGLPGVAGTGAGAVAIAAIAVPAEEEDLATGRAPADDESEGIHASSRAIHEGLDTREDLCIYEGREG
jgi:hypothetical protein